MFVCLSFICNQSSWDSIYLLLIETFWYGQSKIFFDFIANSKLCFSICLAYLSLNHKKINFIEVSALRSTCLPVKLSFKGSFQSAIAPERVPCHEVELCEDLPDSRRFFIRLFLTGKCVISITFNSDTILNRQNDGLIPQSSNINNL